MSSTPTTLDHLQALYHAGTPGEVPAYVKVPFCRRFGVPANLPALARQIHDLDGQGLDVYLTINTLDGQAIRQRGSSTRGMENEVVAVTALVADADVAGKSGHNYPPQTRILQALADMPLPTSIIVASGRRDGGLHVYWLLRESFIIGGDEDRQRIKSVSERWQRLLKTKLAPYDLDSTYDLVRVLRPIGTTNHKYGSIVRALVFEPGRRYRVEDFEEHLPTPPAPRPSTYTPPSNGDTWITIDRARRYVATIPGAVSGQGGHDQTFHVACCLILGFALRVDDALPLLAEWNAACQPPWNDRELRHKLESADQRSDQRGYLLLDRHDQAPPAPGTPPRPKITRLVLQEALS
jgi:hypothetical protein